MKPPAARHRAFRESDPVERQAVPAWRSPRMRPEAWGFPGRAEEPSPALSERRLNPLCCVTHPPPPGGCRSHRDAAFAPLLLPASPADQYWSSRASLPDPTKPRLPESAWRKELLLPRLRTVLPARRAAAGTDFAARCRVAVSLPYVANRS